MSRDTWHLRMSSKRFNVSLYRWLGSLVTISLLVNVILCFLVSRIYFSRPDYIYYSTNGVTKPVQLTPLPSPNESSEPLLGSDPSETYMVKQVPE